MRNQFICACGFMLLATGQAFAAEPAATWAADAQKIAARREYEVSRQGDTLQAPNRAQGFRTTFREQGIVVAPRVAQEDDWEFGLTLAGTGRDGETKPGHVTIRTDGGRVTFDRGSVVEWYDNREDGLEQGFTVTAPGETRGNVFIDLAVSGTLQPRFEKDGRSVEFLRGSIAELRYADLKVFDAVKRELSSHMEPIGLNDRTGIRLVFDDTNAIYPVTVDPLLKSPGWTTNGGQTASWFGYSVSTAGDVNGDGYSDLIVGAPGYDNGQGEEGRAFVYLGGPNGLAATPAWTNESNQAEAQYGWRVAAAGDVNGDGYGDILVSAAYWSNPEPYEGAVWLYYGSPSGPGAGVVVAEGGESFANLGSSIGTAGDVNGDGYADVIIGAPYKDNGQSDEGLAYVYLGSATGIAATPVWTGEGNQAGAAYGSAVGAAGDVNADGYDDIIVGAASYDGPEFNEGRAYVYYGNASGVAASPAWTAEPNQAGAAFGTSVSTAGDVNNDGYADVIVGAPWFDNPEDAEGKVYVYRGGAGGLGAAPFWTLELNTAGAHLGASVATAGDLNGDGFAEIIVGADQNNSTEGRVQVYLGGTESLTLAFNYFGTAGAYLGTSVGTAGDVDGDGFSDFAMGAYEPVGQGSAYVHRVRGAEEPVSAYVWHGEGNQIGSGYGWSVASAGDVNADGYSDVLVGAHLWDNGQADEGRADLYLGSASGLSATAAWSVESNVVVGELGYSVASAGDVNGDGYDDVAVGIPGDAGGRVNVYYGTASGLSTAASWTSSSPTGGSGLFGTSVASAGDVNGDGYSDLVVGAPYYNGTTALGGAAFIFFGSATGLAAAPSWKYLSDGGAFGASVAGAGDVNRDGFSDVLVGAVDADYNGTNSGRAYLFLGAGAEMSPTYAWYRSGQPGEYFGHTVSSAGDFNGDGYSDVVIGYDNCGVAALLTPFLWLGGPGLDVLTASAWSGDLCRAVAPAGDIDNDGLGDFLALNKLYLGSTVNGFPFSTGWAPVSGTAVAGGTPIASAGDVNGDGFADIIYGVNKYTFDQTEEGGAFLYLGGGPAIGGPRRGPRQMRSDGVTPIARLGKSDITTGFHIVARGQTAGGRSKVKLAWEVKPLGTSFDGVVATSSPADTGAPSGGSPASFDVLAAGLGPGTAYHWRSRTISSNPFFPRTPWLSSVGNGPTESKLRTSGCHDTDGDGRGSASDPACASPIVDCNDANAAIWATPGQTANLVWVSKTQLVWDVPSNPGGTLNALRYDTLRALGPASFGAAGCAESDGDDVTSFEFNFPVAGQVFYYLNRPQNACPGGVGSLGRTSAGVERTGRSCP